jgi:signal transduction histidine kinase
VIAPGEAGAELGPRELRWIGLAVALLAAVPAAPDVAVNARQGHLVFWLAALVAYLASFAALGSDTCARWKPARRGLVLGVVTLTGLALVALGGGAFAATYPVLTAAVAGSVLPPRPAFAFAGAQTLGLAAAFLVSGVALAAALSYALIFGALQLFVVHTAQVASAERSARHSLEQAQARLAETSRDAERLRIARDLHDVMGHHLTALSLTLEAASHAEGEPQERAVLEAQILTKRLLRDVRQVVSALREEPGDLGSELRTLAAGAKGVSVHLGPFDGSLDQLPAAARSALLHCAREAATNSARHGGARNLWIAIEPDGGGVRFTARDDGHSTTGPAPGHGLVGIRERVEQQGGRVRWGAAPGGGFELEAWLPSTPEVAP